MARPRRARAVAGVLAGLLLAGCAADPAVSAWSKRWRRVEERPPAERVDEVLRTLRELEHEAPTAADRTRARLDRASTLARAGRPTEAFRLYGRIAEQGARPPQRARARFERALIAEDHGRVEAAVAMYRRIVLTYPDWMPGVHGLGRLHELVRGRGEAAVDAQLAWSRRVYDRLRHTSIGDNLVHFAASTAYRRWLDEGERREAELAEALYRRILDEHVHDGLWDDAIWELSWLHAHREDWLDAIRTLQRLLSTGREATLVGTFESRFRGLARLRIARMRLLQLDSPAEAARDYARYVGDNPESRRRDDALFWAGCAWLRAGRPDRAEEAFDRIPEVYEHSKFLRRLEAARADPEGATCRPEAYWTTPFGEPVE